MIGTKGQYIVKFSIKGVKDDFLAEEDLLEFLLVEEAGNVLPSFELFFNLKNPKFLAYFNEGNTINISIGKDEISLTDMRAVVLHKIMTRKGTSIYQLKITGLMEALDYLNNSKARVLPSKTAFAAIQEVVSTYFTFKTNASPTQDSMNWIQPSIPDKVFVNNLWAHSNLPGSFLAIGIGADSSFILKDVKKAVSSQENYDWRLVNETITNEQSTSKDITIDSDYVIESETGFINRWFGYEREIPIVDRDTGVASTVTPTTNTYMALSKKFDRASAIDSRTADITLQSRNQHSKYWESYISNLSNLALFGSTRIEVSFTNAYRQLKLLDVVMFKDLELDNKLAAESFSGLYLLTRIARQITRKTLLTTMEISRETFNSNKGEFA